MFYILILLSSHFQSHSQQLPREREREAQAPSVALTPITLPPLAVALHLNLNFSLKPKPIMSLDLDQSHPPSLLLFNPTRWSLHVSSTTSPKQHHSTMVFSLSSHFFLSNPSQISHSSLSNFLFL